jgi:phosphoribosylanthranilate isomerase
MRTRVKICGITRFEDAAVAISTGADAIGLVFYPGSPRRVTISQAVGIVSMAAPFVTVTGLFVNATESDIRGVLSQVPLGLLQFHGVELNNDCKRYGLPFIKSIAMRPGADCARIMADYPDACGFLLDAWQPETHGGGGKTFDWSTVPDDLPRPIILAGGLTPDNVATAIRIVHPYAVDVSSGVESARGIKSGDRIRAFMKGVQGCETDTGDGR